ncbi:MAG TPA: FtsX-like permease family protein, partial [Chitinophagaceae bacterium]
TIVGIYKTGIEEYDKTLAIGDIKLIRRLNSWEDFEIGGYEIFLKDYNTMDAVSNTIYDNENFPDLWETKTVKEIYPNIFDWLNIVSYNGGILIVIVMIIVIINFITCLIILVLERVKMIGILKAIGASDWTIQKIFLYHSALITFSGIIIGTAISLGLLWLQMKTGFVRLKETEYYMDTAAVQIDWTQVLLVILGTLVVSMVVLLIPSFLVKKIKPIKAIRFT